MQIPGQGWTDNAGALLHTTSAPFAVGAVFVWQIDQSAAANALTTLAPVCGPRSVPTTLPVASEDEGGGKAP